MTTIFKVEALNEIMIAVAGLNHKRQVVLLMLYNSIDSDELLSHSCKMWNSLKMREVLDPKYKFVDLTSSYTEDVDLYYESYRKRAQLQVILKDTTSNKIVVKQFHDVYRQAFKITQASPNLTTLQLYMDFSITEKGDFSKKLSFQSEVNIQDTNFRFEQLPHKILLAEDVKFIALRTLLRYKGEYINLKLDHSKKSIDSLNKMPTVQEKLRFYRKQKQNLADFKKHRNFLLARKKVMDQSEDNNAEGAVFQVYKGDVLFCVFIHHDTYLLTDIFHHKESEYTFVTIVTSSVGMDRIIYNYIINSSGAVEDIKKFSLFSNNVSSLQFLYHQKSDSLWYYSLTHMRSTRIYKVNKFTGELELISKMSSGPEQHQDLEGFSVIIENKHLFRSEEGFTKQTLSQDSGHGYFNQGAYTFIETKYAISARGTMKVIERNIQFPFFSSVKKILCRPFTDVQYEIKMKNRGFMGHCVFEYQLSQARYVLYPSEVGDEFYIVKKLKQATNIEPHDVPIKKLDYWDLSDEIISKIKFNEDPTLEQGIKIWETQTAREETTYDRYIPRLGFSKNLLILQNQMGLYSIFMSKDQLFWDNIFFTYQMNKLETLEIPDLGYLVEYKKDIWFEVTYGYEDKTAKIYFEDLLKNSIQEANNFPYLKSILIAILVLTTFFSLLYAKFVRRSYKELKSLNKNNTVTSLETITYNSLAQSTVEDLGEIVSIDQSSKISNEKDEILRDQEQRQSKFEEEERFKIMDESQNFESRKMKKSIRS